MKQTGDDGSTAPGVPPLDWLSPDERRVWLPLIGLCLRLPMVLERSLKERHGLSLAEYTVLAVLAEETDHSLRMATIAHHSHLSPSRTTHLVARLERRGLIERRNAGEDGRAITAVLTEAGLALVREASPSHGADIQSRVFERLTFEQLEAIALIASRVRTR